MTCDEKYFIIFENYVLVLEITIQQGYDEKYLMIFENYVLVLEITVIQG